MAADSRTTPMSMDEFRAFVEKSGLENVPDEDLELMKNYWDGAQPLIASLRDAIRLTDEPATVFSPLPARLG